MQAACAGLLPPPFMLVPPPFSDAPIPDADGSPSRGASELSRSLPHANSISARTQLGSIFRLRLGRTKSPLARTMACSRIINTPPRQWVDVLRLTRSTCAATGYCAVTGTFGEISSEPGFAAGIVMRTATDPSARTANDSVRASMHWLASNTDECTTPRQQRQLRETVALRHQLLLFTVGHSRRKRIESTDALRSARPAASEVGPGGPRPVAAETCHRWPRCRA